MSKIRGKNTGPEEIIGRELMKQGLQSVVERHAADLPGRPDFVFRRSRLVIFVDGDFWHGWRFPLWRHKLSPAWQEKIAATRDRDQRNFRKLRNRGWKVLRVWEHQIEQDVAACTDRIMRALAEVRPAD